MSSKNIEDDPMLTRRLLPWTIAASFALHGVAYAALHAPQPAATAAPRKTQLRFEVVQKEQPRPAEPVPPPAPLEPKPAARSEPKPEPAAQVLPGLPPELPPTSDGVTLAADGSSSGFSMPLASGGELSPTRVPMRPAPSAPVPAASLPPPRADPQLVAVGDLSSRPSPPQLGTALERNYPADARRRGLSGSAKVRARIDPDGVVRRVSLVEESALGFGSACSRTLSGSRWAAPKDKSGRSVATEIRYTCRFVVQP